MSLVYKLSYSYLLNIFNVIIDIGKVGSWSVCATRNLLLLLKKRREEEKETSGARVAPATRCASVFFTCWAGAAFFCFL